MSRTRQDHPGAEQLRAFALGRVSGRERLHLEQHISNCDACAESLASVGEDTLTGRLRAAQTLGPALHEGRPESADTPAELKGHPRYRILRRLGSGGMGVVYHAVHRVMDREVAIKVINESLTRHPAMVLRFAQEVRAAARLCHPNIVAAHDAEQAGGFHFLVMEYIEGHSLDCLVQKSGPLTVQVASHFIRQAAMGLQHAHEQGMVHRDIKPQNLMVTRKGQVKILDFGLARLAEEAIRPLSGERPLTAIGTVLGTPDYIAPEQVGNSHGVDIRADIYSLGCTLYFLLAGRPPFPEGTALEKASLHVEGRPVPLLSLRPEVPAELAAVLERMMEKKPGRRYASPGEVALALVAFANPMKVPPSLHPEPPPPLPDRGKRLFVPWIAGIMAGIVVLGVFLGLALLSFGRGQPDATPFVAQAPRVLIVVPARHYSCAELTRLLARLATGHAEAVLASSIRGRLEKEGPGCDEQIEASLTLAEAKAEDYAAVVFAAGPGHEFASDPKRRAEARAFCLAMLAHGKPVAGLSGGASVIGRAGLPHGKFARGNVITARGAEGADEVAAALLGRIGQGR